MKFITISQHSILDSSEGVMLILGPTGSQLDVSDGMNLAPGTVVVIHSEVPESHFVEHQLQLSDIITADFIEVETDEIYTDGLSNDPSSHRFHNDDTLHLVSHQVKYVEVETDGQSISFVVSGENGEEFQGSTSDSSVDIASLVAKLIITVNSSPSPEISEDAPAGTDTGVEFQFSEELDQKPTYSLVDSDGQPISGGAFEINAQTGAVTVANSSLLDAEANNLVDIQVLISYGDDLSITVPVTIQILDVNEVEVSSLQNIGDADLVITEDAAVGSYTGLTVTAADDADASLTFSITDADGNPLTGDQPFAIDPVTGVVTVTNPDLLDAESALSIEIYIRVDSDDGSYEVQPFTIQIGDVDETSVSNLSASDDSEAQISESAEAGAYTGLTVTASDDVTATLTYSITDADGNPVTGDQPFDIDPVTGVVTVSNPDLLDAESAPSIEIYIRVDSDDGSYDVQPFTIAINDTNEVDVSLPSDIDASANFVMEFASNGDSVGITANSTDDVTASITYSISNADGQQINDSPFAVDSATGEVTVANSSLIDYEERSSIPFFVRADSSDGSSAVTQFTVEIGNVNEELSFGDHVDLVVDEDNSILIASDMVLSNAVDVDGDAMSVTSLEYIGSNAIFSDNGNGTWSLTPNEHWNGQLSLNATISDGEFTSDGIVKVSVQSINDNPTLAASFTLHDESSLENSITISDGDSNLLTSASDADHSDLLVDAVNGSSDNVGRPIEVELSFNDADGNPVIELIEITVNADGSYTIAGFDLDELPSGQEATAEFSYHVSDPDGAISETQLNTISITGTNDAPSLSAAHNILSEDELSQGLSVSSSESNLLEGAVDVDDVDSSLAIASINGSADLVGEATVVELSHNDADGNSVTQEIELTINADGSFEINSFDLSSLPQGEFATANFSYQVEDDSGDLSGEVTSTISVAGTNDNPELVGSNNSFSELDLENGISVPANTSNLLSGASDIDDVDGALTVASINGDTSLVGTSFATSLSYTDADGAAQTQTIMLTINADGSYSVDGFDLDALPAGSEAITSFTYNVSDDEGAVSSIETSTLTITGTNDNPELAASNNSFSELDLENGISVPANTSNLLSGASDIDDVDGALTVVSINGDTSLVGTPFATSLSYTDADGAAQTQTIMLTINADGSYSVDGFDLDALPTGSEAITSFTYNVTDDEGAVSSIETSSLTITGTNDNPELVASNNSFSELDLENGISVPANTSNLLTGASDIDDIDGALTVASINGDTSLVGTPFATTLSFVDADGAAQSQAIMLTINADGSYSVDGFDLDALPAGSEAITSFTYNVSDDEGAVSSIETSTLTITGTNDNPELVASNNSFSELDLENGISVPANTSNLLTGASDIDDVDSALTVASINGDTSLVGTPFATSLSYTDADGAAQTQAIMLTVNADGSYSVDGFALDALPTGSEAITSFTYNVSDDEGAVSSIETSTLTITGTNDNPELVASNNSFSEDTLESGISVDVTTSNLLSGASDIDDVDSTLAVASINGDTSLVGTPFATTLSFVDADGAAQSQAIMLTINADGSYSVDGFDLDALPTGSEAITSFTYNVADDEGAVSSIETSTLTITGTNDNPELVASNNSFSEDTLEAGISVDVTTSNLLSEASDIDDVDGALTVASINGDTSLVGTPFATSLSYTDADGAAQTQAIMLTVNADGSYSVDGFALDALPTGSEAITSFTYNVSDDEGAVSSIETSSLTITGTNDNPELVASNNSFSEDALESGISVDVTTSNLLSGASDIDDVDSTLAVASINGDSSLVGTPFATSLSYTDADGAAQSQAIMLTINADGSYSVDGFDLDALPTGSEAITSFTYNVTDDEGAVSSIETSSLTITGTNDNPELVASNNSFSEDALQSGISVDVTTSNLLSAASDIDDVDGALTVASINGDTSLVGTPFATSLSYTNADGVAQSQAIMLTINADGSYSVDGFDLDALPTGSEAITSFTYNVADDEGAVSSIETSTLTITGTNDNPELAASNNSFTEDDLEYGISVDANSSNLLSGASDIDDTTSSLRIGSVNGSPGLVGSPTTAVLNYEDAEGMTRQQDISITINSDGGFSVANFDLDSLPNNAVATATFTYQVIDDDGALSSSQQSTISISGTNDFPELVASNNSFDEDELEAGINVSALDSNLLSGATDSDDSAADLSIASINGSFTDVGNAVTLTLSYNDATGTAQTQDVSLTVNANGSYSIAGFDLDALPAGATAQGTFSYSIRDNDGALSLAETSTISITGTNDAIVRVTDTNIEANIVDENTAIGAEIGITATAIDLDNSDVTYSLVSNEGEPYLGPFTIDPSSGVVTVSGVLDAEESTIQEFRILAESADGTSSTSDIQTVTIADLDEFDVSTAVD
ncbi:MAG: Ig-like domain-containing protein, partial [Pseudomonadales bacterium]